jgi:hypothetical protein
LKRLAPSYPESDTRFYDVESIYFDSPHLDIFNAHFTVLDGRFKLRTRTYGPNGAWDRSSVFLEMKVKRNEVTQKYRIKLDPENQAALFENDAPSLQLSRALHRMNPSVEFRDLSLKIQQINQHLQRLQLRPCSRLLYRRKAFEGEDIRVTLDENIRAELLVDLPTATRVGVLASPVWLQARQMQVNPPISQCVILEIKNCGVLPDWLMEFLEKGRTPEARFSKYCYSVVTHLREEMERTMDLPLERLNLPPALRSISE